MKFEKTDVWGFEGALRGMRNPMNSWSKSDSKITNYGFEMGENDKGLCQRLIAAGPEHCKFLRQIFVSVDITAPMYWWSEFDTYKVGTTANSTSKMHKLASGPITINCFETDDFNSDIVDPSEMIDFLEKLRLKFLETKDKAYWKELVRWLPESWLQTRTITMSYANLRNMVFQRMHHKLNEWSGKDDDSKNNFINWVKQLPYAHELIFYKSL